ncbi:drug/metabolite transporter (DMT)-like permease [Kribbella aluminosa]|uniref:Drug/metabolite transporter (DMT)-like permease n=1 Tax=Kribbella aluminosa TaxID=416017 RepID=A0ABS4UKU7_9ACTN|nr:DMT family transporter [Kribbella aluminosa]MBP2352273.1 drug/metabolite transporter (DMT)-like permease [Kribbella aluminosa]
MTTPDGGPDQAPTRAWLPTMVALAAIWGCSFLFISVGVRELPPLYLALGRVLAGSVVLLAILAVKREPLPRDPRLWAHSFVVGAIGSAIPWTLFGYGEERIPSLLAGIWNGITPLIVLPIAVLIFRTEKFSAQRGFGLLIGFLGVLVVLGAWRVQGGADLAGQGLCMLAAVFYGLAIPYQKRFLAGTPVSGTALSTALLLCATIQLAVVAPLVTGQAPPAPWSLSLKVVLSVLALGALGSGLAFVLNMRNIRLIGASRSSMVTYLMPVFSILVGVIVLHEHITWYQPVGGLIVLAGVAVSQGLVTNLRRKPPLPAEAPA